MFVPATEKIKEVVDEIPGWTPYDELLALFTLAHSVRHIRGDIVEIGSWCGRSAVVLGMAASMSMNTKVHAIDLFPARSDWYENRDGTYSFKVEIDGKSHRAYHEQTVWAEPFERDIMPIYSEQGDLEEIVARNIEAANLTGVVQPYKGDLRSFLASRSDDFVCKLAFIDGDHGYEAVKGDISLIDSYLDNGAWLCFDDAFSCYEGVNKAILELIVGNPSYRNCQQLTRKLFVAQKHRQALETHPRGG